ncbi:MAG: substrate-binding domain-containing protein [Treponema sp.]|nr:substrate-binding domain-containing protein [Treponema sp.]
MFLALFILLSALLLIALFFLVVLYLKEKNKNKKCEDELALEMNNVSDILTKFSFGMLDQRLDVRKLSVSKIMQESIDGMKRAFNKVTSEPLKRVAYVGTDAWFEGIACARHIGEKLKNGGKLVIVVTSSLNALIMAQRHRSFVNTITKDFPKIKIIETFEAHANQENAREYIRKVADKIDAVYITGNSAVSGVTKGLSESNKQGQVFVICHDLDENIAIAMRNGLVSGSVICSTFAQGYDSVVHLFNHIAFSWKPSQPRLMQPLKTITVEDLNYYWNDNLREHNKMADIHNSGTKPMGRAEKPVRILVLCEDWNTAFCQMKVGIEKAQKELLNMNCEVVVKVLNQMKKTVRQVAYEADMAIIQEMNKGLNGICSFVGFAEFVPILNQYASQGIAITTFNSEPLSLRSMIEWVLMSTNQLRNFSDIYKSGFTEVYDMQKNVFAFLDTVVERSNEQNESVDYGAKTVALLTESIDKTAEAEEFQLKTVRETTEIGNQLSQMVSVFEAQVAGLKIMGEQVKKSAQKTEAIKNYSENIESIIGIIDGITEQTNLLAFNAAVESTHAGEWGKGFKVISQEIRGLADKSVESTSNITNLITNMRSAVTEGIEANQHMLDIVNEQVQSVSTAAEQLSILSGSLLEAINQVQEVVETNNNSFNEMHKSAQSINNVMSGTLEISNINTKTIETVSAEFNKMSKMFDDMASRTEKLIELTMIMEGTVASFS